MKLSKILLILSFLFLSGFYVSTAVLAQDENSATEAFDEAVFDVIDFDMIFDDFDFTGFSEFDADEALSGDDAALENIMIDEDPDGIILVAQNFEGMGGDPGEGFEMTPFDRQERFPMMEGPGMGGKGMAGVNFGRGNIGMGGDFFGAMKDNLGLTDDQVKQFKAKHLEFVKNTSKTRADLQVARLELKYLLDEKEPDISAVEKKMQDVNTLTTSLKIAALKNKNESRRILADDQRAKLDEMKKDMPGRGRFMDRMDSKDNKPGGREMPGMKHNM